MNENRKPILERYKRVWTTKEVNEILKRMKKRLGKSIQQIINDLVIEKYGKDN